VRVEIVHTGGRYAERVVTCLASLAPGEVEAYLVPQVFTAALEDAADSLPTGLGSGEVVVAINLPPELLLTIPPLVGGAGVGALIVPVEDPNWIKPGVQRQVEQACREQGMESAFPRPFCALAPVTPVVTSFVEEFGVGVPEVRFEVAEGKIGAVDVLRGAPCGLTDYLAEHLLEQPRGFALSQVAVLHAACPCFGSTHPDPAIGRDAYAEALESHRTAVGRALEAAAG